VLALPDSVSLPRTYATEGAILGGTVLGIASFVLGYVICNDLTDDGNCLSDGIRVGALMAVVGGITGALIGGGVEKDRAEEGR
jgi:hypothetical protein